MILVALVITVVASQPVLSLAIRLPVTGKIDLIAREAVESWYF